MLSSDSTLRIDVANLVDGVYALQVELASSQIRLPIVVQHF
jgi:hypothetical protein